MRWNLKWLTRRGVITMLAAGALATVPFIALAARQSDPFVGSYAAVDTAFDNSNMLLAFGGPDSTGGPSEVRRVVWLDDVAASACDGDRFFAEGVGSVSGNAILVVFEVYCGSAGNLIGEDTVEFVFDPSSGTMTDSYGITWSRP
jgi:hypothetical protein